MTEEKTDEEEVPEGRCPRCRNWLRICGHHLSFKDKLRSIGVDTSWSETR